MTILIEEIIVADDKRETSDETQESPGKKMN